MALSATEEALIRELLDQQAAILSLASAESTIISKLGATKVTVPDLVAASSVTDADLFLLSQSGSDKNVTGAILKAYTKPTINNATESVSGIVELATAAETIAGSDATRATHPSGVRAAIYAALTGQVGFFAMATPPAGWLKADGTAVSRTTYANLFSAIGTTYGIGNGTSTFNLPDLRGEFVRALDDGKGVDAGRVIGSWQSQQTQAHKHIFDMGETYSTGLFGGSTSKGYRGTNGDVDTDNYLAYTNDGTPYGTGTPNANGIIGTETRPRNVALLACIKY